VDSLSNFPEFLAIGGPVLMAALAVIGGAVWWLKAAGRKR
jgi:hypothetical protein